MGEELIVFTTASGNNLVQLPNSMYRYKDQTYLYLKDLPEDLKMELREAKEEFGGFDKMGNIVNASYMDFISNFKGDRQEIKTVDTHDLRFVVKYGSEELVLIKEKF